MMHKTLLTAIIIEDDIEMRENLKILLGLKCPQVKIIAEACDKKSALKVIKSHKPDIAFLDIQLGAYSIFNILNEFDEISFKIIFVTAYNEFAIKGYDYNAIGYLLKPLNAEKLEELIKKAIILKEGSTYQNKNTSITLTDIKGSIIVDTQDILYCVSDGNYTILHFTDTTTKTISKNLKFFTHLLTPYDFFRIHRYYIVNLKHIVSYNKGNNASIVIKNGTKLPISRASKNQVFKKLGLQKT